jgi:hypothetical protein
MILHPLADDFLGALQAQGGPWAPARRAAFVRICEAFADDRGLPTVTGLRQLEQGRLDERLGADWKPVFVDVYRRWVGFRMEREFLEPARPLSPAWWFTAPPLVRTRIHGPLSRLLSPAVGVLLLLVTLAALGLGPLLAHHERREALAAAVDRFELARDRLAAEERSARSLLHDADDESLEKLLARRPTLDSLTEHARRERALLADRAGVELR